MFCEVKSFENRPNLCWQSDSLGPCAIAGDRSRLGGAVRRTRGNGRRRCSPAALSAVVDERKERPAMRRLVTLLVLGGIAIGCGGNGPTSPSGNTQIANLTGTWAGTWRSRISGAALPMRMVIAQGTGG